MSKAILLDTNVLLLWAVGSFDSSLVGQSRLDTYSLEDFDKLRDLIAIFPRVLTTPHVLTELSNLCDSVVPKHRHAAFRDYFATMVEQMDEVCETSAALTKTQAFAELGLADSAVAQLAGKDVLILPVDLPLCRFLWALDVAVENFNHYRDRKALMGRS